MPKFMPSIVVVPPGDSWQTTAEFESQPPFPQRVRPRCTLGMDCLTAGPHVPLATYGSGMSDVEIDVRLVHLATAIEDDPMESAMRDVEVA